VLFGAVLSSFNSLLNSSATLFGVDLFKYFFKKDASEKETVSAGKRFGLIIGVISMIIAPFIAFAPDGLFSYIQQSIGSLSVPILAVVLTGMFTKKVPAIAAKTAMIGGVVLYLISLLFLEPYFRSNALAEAKLQGITDLKELSILQAEAYPHFLHVMGIIFALSIAYMLIVSAIRPRKTAYEPKITDAVDTTPWKYAIVAGIVIALLVLSTYFIF
jgi:SSS family solute:Na+ symporter